AQFQLQQRMVAGITATYHAFNYLQQLRAATAARNTEAARAAGGAEIAARLQALDAALGPLANGPGAGVAHRDLSRRLNDMLVGDVEPTPSVIAGVNGPCRAIDNALDAVRKLQTTSVMELNALLMGAGLSALPAWTPPAAPACAAK